MRNAPPPKSNANLLVNMPNVNLTLRIRREIIKETGREAILVKRLKKMEFVASIDHKNVKEPDYVYTKGQKGDF